MFITVQNCLNMAILNYDRKLCSTGLQPFKLIAREHYFASLLPPHLSQALSQHSISYMNPPTSFSTLRARQNGHRFANDIFKPFAWMKCLNFDWNFTDVCSQGSNWQNASIGPDNGLATNRRLAIIWTNGNLCCWRLYASLGVNELKWY